MLSYPETERAIIGSLLIDPMKLSEVSAILEPDDFTVEAHRLIYRTIQCLADEGREISMVSLVEDLGSNEVLAQVGGIKYIAEMELYVVTSDGALKAAEKVRQSAQRNRILETARLITQAEDTHGEDDSFWEDIQCRLDENIRPPVEWSVPTPLTNTEEATSGLPSFPLNTFPDWLSNFIRAVSTETQTPACFCAIVVLGVLSAALNRKLFVNPRGNWYEPVCLYVLPSMITGERKSPVFKQAMKPLFKHFEALRKQAKLDIGRAKADKLAKQKEFRKSVQGTMTGDPVSEKSARTLAEELETMEEPQVPSLLCSDATPEALADVMNKNGGFANLMDSEGGLFGIIAGRYSKNGEPNFDLFLRAYSCDPLSVDRVRFQGKSIMIPYPFLTMCLTPQPSVIAKLREIENAEDRGLLARFFYSFPKPFAIRKAWPEAVDLGIHDIYEKCMLALCQTPLATNGTAHASQAHVLKLTTQAQVVFKTWMENIEPRRRGDGDLTPIRSWMAKADGIVLRVAALLHAAHHCHTAWWTVLISETTMRHAVRIVAEYAVPHARHAYRLMGIDKSKKEPVKRHGEILDWIKSRMSPSITYRSLQQNLKHRYEPEDLLESLKYLDRMGWIRTVWGEKKGARHPVRYDVNPCVVERKKQ